MMIAASLVEIIEPNLKYLTVGIITQYPIEIIPEIMKP
jgi:hypothetical protein